MGMSTLLASPHDVHVMSHVMSIPGSIFLILLRRALAARAGMF